MVQLSSCVQLTMISRYVLSATPKKKFLVWALSFSLAATKKINFSFSSSRYLDVSIPWVYLRKAIYSLYDTWDFPCEFPHSEIFGSLAMCAYPKLIAAYHVLHRLLMPRHSPRALSLSLRPISSGSTHLNQGMIGKFSANFQKT